MIFLHIGRTKTGTTALQSFLGSNTEALSRADLHFPPAGFRGNAHHDVALALTPKRMQRASEEAQRMALSELNSMKQQVGSGRNLVVSSEMFQQADPRLVATLFPPGQTRIIVYLREQYDYLISAYSQRIQVSLARTPFVRYADRFNPDYLPFLDSWADCFGEENLDVGIYDRALLFGGDIRQDFLMRLNISSEGFLYNPSRGGNPTIGAELIEFKAALNSLMPSALHVKLDLAGQLSRIAGRSSKFAASASFAAAYRAQFETNRIVEEKYLASRPIPKKMIADVGTIVDRHEAVEFGLEMISETEPAVGRRIGRYLSAKTLADLDPVLPQDWNRAVEHLNGGGHGRKRVLAFSEPP